MSIPVILDVDTGIDDAMAVMFAIRHPELDVRAITCVAGNVDVDRVAANTLAVLDLVGAAEVPVAKGATRPLLEAPRDASLVHGVGGLGTLTLPASARTLDPRHAIELLAETLAAAPEPITIVALAPMTNLALLLRVHPESAAHIRRIVFMGGSARGGNATAVAEFNVWHDPEAAAIVLDAGIPLTMYGLDVFTEIDVAAATVTRLCASADPLAAGVGALLAYDPPTPSGEPRDSERLIGDAGAVCSLACPELFSVRELPVHVELHGAVSRGQTVVDRRPHGGEDAVHGAQHRSWASVRVVLAADERAVESAFLDTVVGAAAHG